MYRKIIDQLLEWKNSKHRKPLLLEGQKFLGKTYILKEFGAKYFKNVVYLDFENVDSNNNICNKIFQKTKNPKKIIENLKVSLNVEIENDTLIIYDEVGYCNNALGSMKYFCEDMPEIYLIATSSYSALPMVNNEDNDFNNSNSIYSFPVGKVLFLRLHPMNFLEFLITIEPNFIDIEEKLNSEKLEDFIKYTSNIKAQLETYFRIYESIGGIPKAVHSYIDYFKEYKESNKDKVKDNLSLKYKNRINEIIDEILESYYFDFSKLTTISNTRKMKLIMESIPNQYMKKNKKFTYSSIKKGSIARNYETSLFLLTKTRILNASYLNTKQVIPLKVYNDTSSFKLYYFDFGFLRRAFDLGIVLYPEIKLKDNVSDFTFNKKAAIIENYIFQALISQYDENPSYYKGKIAAHNINFLIQHNSYIIPIEINIDNEIDNKFEAKAINKYKKEHKESFILGVRFSYEEIYLRDGILNIPIFLADFTKKLIEIALKNII